MTTTLSFGTSPIPGVIKLSRYSDFVTEMISNTGSWPDTAQIEFRFLAANTNTWVTWPATISGPIATWNVDKDDVAAMLNTGATRYWLFYLEGDYDLEWSKGPIEEVT